MAYKKEQPFDEQKLSQLFDFATSVRGMIVSQTVVTERVIDIYISYHFCDTKTKRNRLMDLVLSNERMTFEGKKQVFKVLTEKYDNVFVHKYPSIFRDLDEIMVKRNIYAHYLLDTSPAIINKFKMDS